MNHRAFLVTLSTSIMGALLLYDKAGIVMAIAFVFAMLPMYFFLREVI